MLHSSKSTTYSQVETELDIDQLSTGYPLQHGEAVTSSRDQSPKPKLKFFRDSGSSLRTAWRFIVKSGALAGTLIFLINLCTLIVIYTKFDIVDYAAVVYQGSCTTTNQVVIGSHVIINVLSTVLLAYSNYSMQCVSAPTRKEIDKAHSRRRWLSIGAPTIRNLFFVSPWKSGLWILLCISSFPLHFLWNSTVFQTQVSLNYYAISVTPDAFDNRNSIVSINDTVIASAGLPSSLANVLRNFQDVSGEQSSTKSWERLDVEACINAYGIESVSTRTNVILVVDPVNITSPSHPILAGYASDDFLSFQWMCDASFTMNSIRNGGGWKCPQKLLDELHAGQNWIPGQFGYSSLLLYGAQDGNPVQYCYSEIVKPVDQHCKVNVVPLFLIVVIICNAIKVISFILCLRITKRTPPVLTTGDAIASFLERPDEFTKGRCLASKYDYNKGYFFPSKEWNLRPSETFDVWEGGRYRWGKAVRGIQWAFYMICVSAAIILAGAMLGPDGVGTGTTESWPSIWSLGIGKPHKNFWLVSSDRPSLLVGFLVANWSQLVVSYLYLFLSNMFTTMSAMAEFCAFSRSTRGLRVSNPQKHSEQRSSYFLSLPYRYAIPLTISVATLHYFVSQMVFLAQIDVYDQRGNLDLSASETNVFFSPLAMFVSVSLGSAIVLVLIVVGIFKKYPSTPLAGCCSASIAASCQPMPGHEDFPAGLALQKLKWGVISHDTNGVGHATFTDAKVERLQLKHGYA